MATNAQRFTPERKEEYVSKTIEDPQPSCLEKWCPCLTSKPSKPDNVKGQTGSSSGKTSMSDQHRNGDMKTDYRNGGHYVDDSGWEPVAKRSNGEAVQTRGQKSSGSGIEKWLEPEVAIGSSPEAGNGMLKEKQRKLVKKESSPEPDLSRVQERSSPEADPLLSKEQKKFHPPNKTQGNERKKASPPMETGNSSEVDELLKEHQKIESERKTASSSIEAGQVLSKEQQKIEPPRKTVSSTQESQLLSNERQRGLINEETSYGNHIEKKLDSPMKTSNSPNHKQGGHLYSKEQEKDAMQEGIRRASNYAESSPAKETNRSSGNPFEERHQGVLEQGNNSQSHTSLWKEKQKDVVKQEGMERDDKYADNGSSRGQIRQFF